MASYSTLQELLLHSRRSKIFFDGLNREVQVMLQEQRQEICTYADLERAAASFERRGRGW